MYQQLRMKEMGFIIYLQPSGKINLNTFSNNTAKSIHKSETERQNQLISQIKQINNKTSYNK
jgi:hypothetical protein